MSDNLLAQVSFNSYYFEGLLRRNQIWFLTLSLATSAKALADNVHSA